MEEVIQNIYRQARQLGCCNLFKGTEDVESVLRLFASTQGMEFCMEHRFPNLTTMRKFKEYDPELLVSMGIYVDAGAINLRNPRRVILAGHTLASISYDTLEEHDVYVMHGAKCNVSAWQWAVVRVQQDSTSEVLKTTYNNAIIL